MQIDRLQYNYTVYRQFHFGTHFSERDAYLLMRFCLLRIELIEFSFGQGMTSVLFQTFVIFPFFRELLNILIMTGTSISAYVFQNQYEMSSPPDVVRFRRSLCPMSDESEEGILVFSGITESGEKYSRGQYLYIKSKR